MRKGRRRMARRGACVSWAVLLIAVLWLAGTASGLAQAAAEAAGIGAAASSAGGAAARATGQTIGSVLGRTGAKVETSTQTATPAVSARTNAQVGPSGSILVTSTRIPASAGGAQAGTFTVLGPPPQIHFDVVLFKQCAGVGSSCVPPLACDAVTGHCATANCASDLDCPVSQICDVVPGNPTGSCGPRKKNCNGCAGPKAATRSILSPRWSPKGGCPPAWSRTCRTDARPAPGRVERGDKARSGAKSPTRSTH